MVYKKKKRKKKGLGLKMPDSEEFKPLKGLS